MPLADAVAVAYVSPLLVTALSVVVPGRKGRPPPLGWRWASGMVGVIVMLRPGAGVIQPAALLVLVSAVLLRREHMLTRHMGGTESAVTMAFYVQLGLHRRLPRHGALVGDGHLATRTTRLWPSCSAAGSGPDGRLADLPGLGLSVGDRRADDAQAYRLSRPGWSRPSNMSRCRWRSSGALVDLRHLARTHGLDRDCADLRRRAFICSGARRCGNGSAA